MPSRPGTVDAATPERAARAADAGRIGPRERYEANRAAHRTRWPNVPVPPWIEAAPPGRVRPRGRGLQLRTASGEYIDLHDAGDPGQEAARWLTGTLEDRSMPRTICVIGAGLGYVLDAVESASGEARLLVLEPEPDVVPHLLARRDWRPLIESGRLLVISGPAFEGAADAWRALDGEAAPLVLSHPVVVRHRRDAAVAAARVLKRALNDWRSNHEAREALAGMYVANTLDNLRILARSGDVADLQEACTGAAALVLGAGPSLDRNLKALLDLRDARARAIVISVDTALRPCLSAGLSPHFVVAVDPTPGNARHLAGVRPPPDTWLVAEASVDPRAFGSFPERTVLFRVAGHPPWPSLQAEGLDRGVLRVWGSVLTAAVDFALHLGCDPIVLAGADLAYTDRRPYCRGTVFEDDWADAVARGHTLEDVWTQWLKEPAVFEPGLDGTSVRTASHLLAFRDWLVDLSRREPTRRFVNATGAGVLVGGGFQQATIAAALPSPADAVRPPVIRPRPAPAAALLSHPGLEALLAAGPTARRRLDTELRAQGLPEPFDGFAARAVEAREVARLGDAGESSGSRAAARAEIGAVEDRLTGGGTADAELTDRLVDLLQSDGWISWALADKVELVGRVCELYGRNRSALSNRVYPGLTRVFQTLAATRLHPGHATQLYDHLYALAWTQAADPSELYGFAADVVRPMASRARSWASDLGLQPRRRIGEPPYRVAYLSRNSRLVVGDAVARLTLSLLYGHAERSAGDLCFSYYAWNGIDDEVRGELERLGVAVRVRDWGTSPCASLAALRGDLIDDRIDVLVTDQNRGVPTVLFETRAAPIQIFLEMGFPAWGLDTIDYSFLSFAADPDRLGLSASDYERIEYRFHRKFVESAVSEATIARARERFRRADHVFGFVGRLVKLAPDYFRAAGEILRQAPGAMLYLGGAGDAAAVEHALRLMDDVRDRIVFDRGPVDGAVAIRVIDTFLDTFPFVGGLSCLQAQAAGRPVVFLADSRPGVARLQRFARDPALRGGSPHEYVATAVRLATDPDGWAQASREARAVAARASDTTDSAGRIEQAIHRLVRRQQGA